MEVTEKILGLFLGKRVRLSTKRFCIDTELVRTCETYHGTADARNLHSIQFDFHLEDVTSIFVEHYKENDIVKISLRD